ncbi:MAG TPA: outer membrane protein transport protein [Chthoniobacterales bacterium]
MRLPFALFITLGFASPSLFALGIRVPDQHASATGRGEAFVATADNPSAIYYNPAGITQLEGDQFSIGAYGIDLKTEYTSPTGVRSESDNDPQAAPHIYYTHQFSDERFVAGFGFYTPYGLSNEYPDDAPFRTVGRKGSIQYLTFAPTLAAKITSTLSVAASINYNHATAELSQGIFAPGDESRFKGDDGALSFKLGLLWQPTPQHSFGVSYQSESRFKLRGGFENKPYTPREDAEADFNFPQFFIIGYSFRPTPEWNFEFNYDWTDWNELNDVTVTTASGSSAIAFNWENSAFYEFGITRKFGAVSLSVGYIYSESSVPEANFSPLVPDSERHIFSAGFGYKADAWSVDLAYQYAHGPERTIVNSVSPSLIGESANGKYEFNSHAISLDFGIAF